MIDVTAVRSIEALEEPKRSTLEALRRTIREVEPDAEQVISYRVPAFRVGGQTVAGFAAFKNHLGYLAFSGSVLSRLADAAVHGEDELEVPPDRTPAHRAATASIEAGASRSSADR